MRSDSSRQWSNEQLTPACERAQVLISRHIDGELQSADATELRAHLSACPGCRNALEIQTAQSQEMAEAFKKLWPGDAASDSKKKSSTQSERWVASRKAMLRAASILVLAGGIILFAARAKAPSDPAAQTSPVPSSSVRPVAVDIENSGKRSDLNR